MSRSRVQALPAELRELFQRVVDEAEANPQFAAALKAEFGARRKRGKTGGISGRRARGVIDPFAFRQDGEQALRDRLNELTVEQLKDIVAEHGMDPGKLAMTWKTPERLVDLIVETVERRRTKGAAFREQE